jgi:hypothetical protein
MSRRAGCGEPTERGPVSLHRIVGVAVSADTTAYVLHEDALLAREEEPAIPPADPMVMRLRLRDGVWRILPSRGLLRPTGTVFSYARCDSTGRPR